MVAGADRVALRVEQVGHVFRVKRRVEERDHGRIKVIVAAVDRATEVAQGCCRPSRNFEQAVVLCVKVHLLEVIHGCFPPDGFGDARGPCLEFVFVVLVGGTLDGDLVDHVASAHERRHFIERRFVDRQTADAGRSEHLVGRNREEINVKFGDVNSRVGRALCCVEQHASP